MSARKSATAKTTRAVFTQLGSTVVQDLHSFGLRAMLADCRCNTSAATQLISLQGPINDFSKQSIGIILVPELGGGLDISHDQSQFLGDQAQLLSQTGIQTSWCMPAPYSHSIYAWSMLRYCCMEARFARHLCFMYTPQIACRFYIPPPIHTLCSGAWWLGNQDSLSCASVCNTADNSPAA